jgi:hypothetical protein
MSAARIQPMEGGRTPKLSFMEQIVTLRSETPWSGVGIALCMISRTLSNSRGLSQKGRSKYCWLDELFVSKNGHIWN